MVKGAIAGRMKAMEVSPLLGKSLDAAVTEDRHVPVLDGIIGWASRTLDANEDLIRSMVHDKSGWVVRFTGLDSRVADGIIDALRRLTVEMAGDVHHPLREKAEDALAALAWDLQYDEAMRAKVEAAKKDIIANKAFGDWIDGLWEKTRAGLLKAARDPDATMAGKFGEAIRALGATLQEDPRLKATINQFARRAVVGAVAAYGTGIVTLVSDTIRGWDAGTVTARLENAVGRDLQYIRINGTLVGGLVGLIIHIAELVA